MSHCVNDKEHSKMRSGCDSRVEGFLGLLQSVPMKLENRMN
jgi:hypothetical protein